jgi:hypothetical protein
MRLINPNNLPENIWLWLCFFISAGALVYFIHALDYIGLIAAILIATFLFVAFKKSGKNKQEKIEKQSKSTKAFWLWAGVGALASITTIVCAYQARTDSAIISPWTETSPLIFLSLGLSSLALIAALSQTAKNIHQQLLLSLYYLSLFSLAAIIYRLGYGFDPFIHQAAMAEISQHGYILPKTPYYLGQYSLIIALHKFTGISLGLINQWFLPIFSALALPYLLSYLAKGISDNKNKAWQTSLLLLIIGFSPLIISTPQNFSYLLLLATVIFIYKNARKVLIISTAVASFAVHPLAGIPALFLTALILIPSLPLKVALQKILQKPLITFGSALLMFCLSLWAVAGFSALNLQSFNLSLLNPVFANSENYSLNLSYFFFNNYFWLILGGTLLIFFQRKKIWPEDKKSEKKAAQIFSLSALAAISAYLISRGFSFSGLITYEQDDYAARLPIIALIILTPLYWELLLHIIKAATRYRRTTQIIMVIGGAILVTTAVYGSYPRFDHYHNSRGYSSSASDISAVRRAEERAQGENYIVLANQQVSAAALREIGFRRYLSSPSGEIYFYPIPTGGPLYQYFLEMVYKQANQETMERAMDFAGVRRSYLIINKYWWASDKIIAEAKMSADYWEKIGQGENYLFEYRK